MLLSGKDNEKDKCELGVTWAISTYLILGGSRILLLFCKFMQCAHIIGCVFFASTGVQ